MAVRPDTTTKNAAPMPADFEEDLEQYGVWVKAEPQDIVEESEAIPLAASDFDLASSDNLPEEESFLSEDEEKLLGSFEELDAAAEFAPHLGEDSVDQFEMESSSIPDIENLPPLEDFEIRDESVSDIEDLGASTIDISLDDLEAPGQFSPDAHIDMKSIRGLGEEAENLDFAEPKRPAPPSPAPASGDIEDVSAEFLDFADSSADTGFEGSDVTSEFLDGVSEPSGKPRQGEPEPDFEPIDMELHFDDTLATDSSNASSGEPGFEAVSEFDDFLQEDDRVSSAPPPVLERFDDVSAVERELSEPIAATPRAPRQGSGRESPVDASLSNDLLQKIAEELSSIRSELVMLKGQFGALKLDEGHREASSAPASEAGQKTAKPASGFFDEEEDETIALTGDELDNILNTADFTEETAGETTETLDLGSVDSDNESILPESGDYLASGEGQAIEEIRLEPSAEMPSSAAETEDFSDIDLMVDEGVQHLTQAPEDTSYLEEPLPNEEPLDLTEIPLHEESLVDENALDMNMEVEDIEPLSEISEELPVVDEEGGGLSAPESLADITLGMSAASDYMPETVSEAQSLEAIPEFEESGFADINLAEEEGDELVEEVEEVEELGVYEEDRGPFGRQNLESSDLAAKIAEKTVKPAEPISFHPDEIPMSLDDSFFVGGPAEGKEAQIAQEMPGATAAKPAVKKADSETRAPLPGKEADNDKLKSEIRGILSYLDKLLESLPESKIDEFAHSEYFDTYKKLFEELGLV